MKGFIEVTEQFSKIKIAIAIRTISFFHDNWIVQDYNDGCCQTSVKESYEEIKELIKNAQ